MRRPSPGNKPRFSLPLGIAIVILLSACGDDRETKPEYGFGETETQSAVILVNGLQVMTLTDAGGVECPDGSARTAEGREHDLRSRKQ